MGIDLSLLIGRSREFRHEIRSGSALACFHLLYVQTYTHGSCEIIIAVFSASLYFCGICFVKVASGSWIAWFSVDDLVNKCSGLNWGCISTTAHQIVTKNYRYANSSLRSIMAVCIWYVSSLLPFWMPFTFSISGWAYHPDFSIPLLNFSLLKSWSGQLMSESSPILSTASPLPPLGAQCLSKKPLSPIKEPRARGFELMTLPIMPTSPRLPRCRSIYESYKDKNSDRPDGIEVDTRGWMLLRLSLGK